MAPSPASSEPRVNPLAPVDLLWQWLLATTLHLVLGLAIAWVFARLMRRHCLHWSWAAAALAVVVVARALLAGAAIVLAIAALGAAALGRRWRRDDLEAGRDLADFARSSRSLATITRAAVGKLLLRWRLRSDRGWFCGDELIIGCDRDNQPVSIPLGGSHGGTHTLVLGATGSGKTITQSWIAVRAIERGMGAVVVDPKGDPGLQAALREASRRCSRQLIEWSPTGPAVYNPYAHGSDSEIADKVLAGERFTEPHYLRQAQRYVGHAVRALRATGRQLSLSSLVEHLDAAALERLARTLDEDRAAPVHAYLDSLTVRQRQDLAGVRDRLAILAESDLGVWLDPQPGSGRAFDLLEAVSERAVVYFRLDADSRPLLAQMLGAAIVQDLQSTVASLQDRSVPTLALIDEFAAISAEQVVRLFGRARSAGFSLLLGTQELADLQLSSHERVLERVIGNLSVLIAHRQVMPESCALVTSLGGLRGAWRTSQHSDGRSTRTRTSVAVLDPDGLMSLAPGQAAVAVLNSSARARIAQIFALGWR